MGMMKKKVTKSQQERAVDLQFKSQPDLPTSHLTMMMTLKTKITTKANEDCLSLKKARKRLSTKHHLKMKLKLTRTRTKLIRKARLKRKGCRLEMEPKMAKEAIRL